MGFESTLKQTASEVEAVMSDLLAFNGADARTVIDAMRYSALGQGKRLRPFFVTESAGLFGVDRAHALREKSIARAGIPTIERTSAPSSRSRIVSALSDQCSIHRSLNFGGGCACRSSGAACCAAGYSRHARATPRDN